MLGFVKDQIINQLHAKSIRHFLFNAETLKCFN